MAKKKGEHKGYPFFDFNEIIIKTEESLKRFSKTNSTALNEIKKINYQVIFDN
jgi:hypothetical protein